MALESYVLFIDILGFADLVLNAGEVGVQFLQPTVRDHRDFRRLPPEIAPLAHTFAEFHRALQDWAPSIRPADSGGTSLVFSDCAFLQVHNAKEVAFMATRLMQTMVVSKVPVRIGLGKGELRILRFQSDTFGFSVNHATQFLGPGVVRAVKAESCGAQGLRILVDPSLDSEFSALDIPMVPVGSNARKWPVAMELNYLPDEWDFEESLRADHDGPTSMDTFELEFVDRVKDLKLLAPPEKHHIYQETCEALSRMRAQRGRSPVTL